MTRKYLGLGTAAVLMALVTSTILAAPPAAFTTDSSDAGLLRPPDVRELVFLSSGYGMAYGPAAAAARQADGTAPFTNVFVTREGYLGFMRTGQWPDGTTFFLEVRQGEGHTANDVAGASQGKLIALEAEQKDSKRYPDGFAFFDLSRSAANQPTAPLPRTATCYTCHRQHGAVEWTFTQFYPEQFAVAQRLGTVRKDYDPNGKLK